LPPEDSWVAGAVLVSPGGPAHVMLTDREAEHIPGCNMAFYKWALEAVGEFDPIFRKAGDDVDICWRLQQHGLHLGFSSGGFVWHYRRSNVADYLEQQRGYGEAEALLAARHAEYFSAVGTSVWRGRIYASSKLGVTIQQPRIYHGPLGAGWFQTLYTAEPAALLTLTTTLEFHVLVTLPLLVLAVSFSWLWPLAVTSLAISLCTCAVAAAQAEIPGHQQRFWSRPLVALLFFLQPIVRGLARYQGRLNVRPMPAAALKRLDALPREDRAPLVEELNFWTPSGFDRLTFIKALMQRLDREGWNSRPDAGWSHYDVEIYGSRWSRLQLVTVAEQMPDDSKLLRCRLRAGWSLPAKIVFWSLLGTELLVIGLAVSIWSWLWMLPLTMPIFGLFLEQEKRTLRLLIASLSQDVAKELGLKKVESPDKSAAS